METLRRFSPDFGHERIVGKRIVAGHSRAIGSAVLLKCTRGDWEIGRECGPSQINVIGAVKCDCLTGILTTSAQEGGVNQVRA